MEFLGFSSFYGLDGRSSESSEEMRSELGGRSSDWIFNPISVSPTIREEYPVPQGGRGGRDPEGISLRQNSRDAFN